MKTKSALAAAITLGVLSAAAAAATSLSSSSNTLQAGSDLVADCDTSSPKFTLAYTKDGSANVTAVTVGDVASACFGGTLTVGLADAAGLQLRESTLGTPIDAASETVPISPAVPAADVDQVDVAVIGP